MDLERISRAPARGRPRAPHLLFVHGAFHGADCWDEHYLPYFADRGWHAHALSLRGHGRSGGVEALQAAGLADYEQDIDVLIDGLDGPVVLIGHSMGGVLAERRFLARAEVAGLVLLACSPLRPALSVVLKLFRRAPGAMLRGFLGRDPERARPAFEAFFYPDELAETLRARYRAMLCGESQAAMDEVFGRAAAVPRADEARPVLVVGGIDDWSIPMSSHARLTALHGAQQVLVPGSHDLMLDPRWELSAARILAWLEARFPADGAGIESSAHGGTQASA